MVLDVWSDLVCPWCYIGKTRLQKALAGAPGAVQLRWRAFELQPDLPPEGVDAVQLYTEKFGGAEQMDEVFARTADVASQDGLTLHFDRMQRAPNTRLAHRAVKLAADPDRAVAALFRAHFEDGLDLARRDVILDVLGRDGLDARTIGEGLDAGGGLEEVLADEQLAAELGISGVPFFVADQRLAVSGAQPPEVFKAFLEHAAAQPARD